MSEAWVDPATRPDRDARYADVRRVTLVGSLVDLVLALMKIAGDIRPVVATGSNNNFGLWAFLAILLIGGGALAGYLLGA